MQEAVLMKRFVACVVALALVGCSQSTIPEVAKPAPSAPTAQETTDRGFAEDGRLDEPELANRVLTYFKDQGIRMIEIPDKPVLYAVKLGQVPKGYDGFILTFASDSLLLFATDAAHTKLEPIARLDDVPVNVAKLFSLTSDVKQITFMSQAPFRATEVHYTIGWDGSNLTVVDHKVTDPTADYYRRLEAMVEKRDLDGIMKERGGYLYPDFYSAAFSLPPQVLRLAHEESLAAYQAGNLVDALRYLTFGIDQYQMKYGLLEKKRSSDLGKQYELPVTDLVPIVNDYAFFMAESGRLQEAEPLLLQVIKNAPDRTVAHLNLADVEWGLGKHAEAKSHYRAYLEMLGPDKGKAPPRVSERLK